MRFKLLIGIISLLGIIFVFNNGVRKTFSQIGLQSNLEKLQDGSFKNSNFFGIIKSKDRDRYHIQTRDAWFFKGERRKTVFNNMLPDNNGRLMWGGTQNIYICIDNIGIVSFLEDLIYFIETGEYEKSGDVFSIPIDCREALKPTDLTKKEMAFLIENPNTYHSNSFHPNCKPHIGPWTRNCYLIDVEEGPITERQFGDLTSTTFCEGHSGR